MVKPKMLKKGSKVAIVSLSRGILGEPFAKHEVDLLEKRLSELGLTYEYMPNSKKDMEYLAEHPEARAEDLKAAFLDDSIDMIWCAIGGEDTYLTLPYLMNEDFQNLLLAHPKIFMGFSDTTNNHLMFQKLGLNTYYGPALLTDLAEFSPEMLPYTAKCIKNLFNNNRGIVLESSPIWYQSRTDFGEDQVGVPAIERKEEKNIEFLGPKQVALGELLGGCIESLYESAVCSRFPEKQREIFGEFPIFPNNFEWQGKILFIETSEEQPSPEKYRKMIKELEGRGVFQAVVGVLVGKPMDEKYYDEYKEIVSQIAGKYHLPVAYNMNFGHATPRMILPYGQIAKIDPEKQQVSLREPLFISELDEIIRVKLLNSVDVDRYVHSILVAEVAKRLAIRYDLDAEKAYTAGLTHDIAKRLSPEEEKYFVRKYQLDDGLLSDTAKNYRHSDIGAVVAKEWFDLDDEICQAIRLHTIPTTEMTSFDKVIFLADKLGRRDFENSLEPLRELAFEDLDKAMLFFLDEQAKDLEKRGIKQHPDTVKFIESLQAQ